MRCYNAPVLPLRVIFFFLFVSALCAREFDPRRDGMAFANETVFGYGVDESGRLHVGLKDAEPEFSHRCFCVVRAVMQFWKFARFEPSAPRLSSEEYRARLRQLFRIHTWLPDRPARKRIVFPGYPDLWSLSRSQQRVVQEEIGAWLPTYIRVGNWRMACPLVRFIQGSTARAVASAIESRGPQGLYLAKFPSMNHAVVAYAVERAPDGVIRFRVYDPNYPGSHARLDYNPARNLFEFERRFYWPGGELRAMRIYISPIH